MSRRVLGLPLLAAVAACSSSGDPAPASSTSAVASLPCDVAAILDESCTSCHASPPKFGAPMPLVTPADFQAKAKSDPSKTVAELVRLRMNDATNPMPASGMLPKAKLDVVNAWLDQGAPKGAEASCGDAGAGPSGPKAGPEHLPCPESERVTFLAHGGDAPKFHVPADAGNLNECFYFKSPFEPGAQATSFAPVIDDARVVHHWILFETATPQAEGTFGKCKMPLDATFLTGWAPGAGNRDMPADVGMKLPGKEKWLILQLHYWNVAGYSDANDASGVSMCVTNTPRKNAAVISTLGSLAIDVPAKAMGVEVSGTCTPELTEPVYILASAPHMHGRGRSLKTELLRAGDPATSESVVQVDAFDFNAQGSYPTPAPLEVRPGDKLKTTCVYDNPGNTPAYFGERTEDEMCFNFVLVYPETGLVNAGGKSARRCIDK